MVKCSVCKKWYDVSLALTAKGEVKVAKCRVCPVDAVYAVCENCSNIGQIQDRSCPSCNAQNMWEITKMISV